MLKRLVWIMALFCFLITTTTAIARDNINPMRPEAERLLKMKQDLLSTRENRKAGRAASNVTIHMDPSEPAVGDSIIFTVKVNGVIDDNVVVEWGIADEGRDPYGWLFTRTNGEPTIEYVFYSAGSYSCFAWVYSNNERIGAAYLDFAIEDDDTHLSLEEKAVEIVRSCKGISDWETALNLHDWLTQNLYYDDTYEHYGADAIYRGYGVCDSYAKAYALLCNTAGIPAERITSNTHGWNTVCLNGEWYQVDCTWDDPGSGPPAKSGHEVYEFFCLNSTIMQQIEDHELKTTGHALDCTSLDMNYYIHTGQWRKWGDRETNSTNQQTVVPWTMAVIRTFSQGYDVHEFVPGRPYYLEDDGSAVWSGVRETPIINGIWSYGLNGYDWQMPTGEVINVETEFEKGAFRFRLKGWNGVAENTVILPSSLKEIQEEAFAGTLINTFILPQSCTMIGPKAFADSSVKTIHIPAEDAEIDTTALDGCGYVIVVTDVNSETAVNARTAGLMVVDSGTAADSANN